MSGIVGFTEAAHATTGGMGRKSDAKWLVPLTGRLAPYVGRGPIHQDAEGLHRELHRIGIKSFEAKYGVDLRAIASRLYRDYQYMNQSFGAANR